MFTQLKAFVGLRPEIIFTWKDPETEAEGWLVINSLKNGAAGGGTRMGKDCSLEEVISLAKTMEIRFHVSGPMIGGAASGIRFDPEDTRKTEVLKRWYKAILPLLSTCYGTSGDLNVDEATEVQPILHKSGLLHPQEGIVAGCLQPNSPTRKKILKQLLQATARPMTLSGFTADQEEPITLADMAAGFGVAEAVRHYYRIWDRPAANKRVLIQGFGNVGGAAALTLAQAGFQIVGIIDKRGGVLAPEGISSETLLHLYRNRKSPQLAVENSLSFEQINMGIWSTGAEVFIPAADSRLITKYQLDDMRENGLEVIACGANIPFKDADIFLGETGLYADNKIAVIPDFIANCGRAHVLASVIQEGEALPNEPLLQAISDAIGTALEKTHHMSPLPRGLWQGSLQWVLDELLQQSPVLVEK